MLGYDPMYLACEGRVVAVMQKESATPALTRLKELGYSQAAVIGSIENDRPQVVLETELGGERILEELTDEPLPRIC